MRFSKCGSFGAFIYSCHCRHSRLKHGAHPLIGKSSENRSLRFREIRELALNYTQIKRDLPRTYARAVPEFHGIPLDPIFDCQRAAARRLAGMRQITPALYTVFVQVVNYNREKISRRGAKPQRIPAFILHPSSFLLPSALIPLPLSVLLDLPEDQFGVGLANGEGSHRVEAFLTELCPPRSRIVRMAASWPVPARGRKRAKRPLRR